jgi:Domain of unknown function (DUF4258)
VSATFDRVRALARQRKVRVSRHGYVGLAARGIVVAEIIAGAENGEPIEDYPDYFIGPAVLVLQRDGASQPLHVVWGIEKSTTEPAVIVTAYRPRSDQWSQDFKSRRP